VIKLFLNSDHVRAAFLNSIMLLVFAAAWVSDAWPQATVLALGVAFAVVVGTTASLYFIARRASIARMASKPSNGGFLIPHKVKPKKQEVGATLPREDRDHFEFVASRGSDVSHSFAMRVLDWHSRRNVALTKRDATFIAYIAATHDYLCELQKIDELHLKGSQLRTWQVASARDLESWKFIPLGPSAFNVEAGAFVIEYSRGHTNIRVLDPARITVEGGRRRVKDFALSEFCAPIWSIYRVVG
jgi:hypothetical protein